MATSGLFAETGYEPKLTNSQNVVAWSETQNHCGPQAGYGPISSITPWRSTRNFTEEAIAHNNRQNLAEQHACWPERTADTL